MAKARGDLAVFLDILTLRQRSEDEAAAALGAAVAAERVAEHAYEDLRARLRALREEGPAGSGQPDRVRMFARMRYERRIEREHGDAAIALADARDRTAAAFEVHTAAVRERIAIEGLVADERRRIRLARERRAQTALDELTAAHHEMAERPA